jgi:DNA gyrase/topoisomerase IV subunit B
MLNVLEAKMTRIADNEEIDSIIKILGTKISTRELPNSGKYYLVTPNNDKDDIKYTIYQDDLFLDTDGIWKDPLNLSHSEYTIYETKRNLVDPELYYAQSRVNQKIDTNYNYVIAATDQDLDGIHIRALVLTLFNTFLPQFVKAGKLKYLQTPLIALRRGSAIVEYFFNMEDYKEFVKSNSNVKGEWRYYKGLGTWAEGELRTLITKDGLDNFLKTYNYDDLTNEKLTNWMSKQTSEYRKNLIKESYIDIDAV